MSSLPSELRLSFSGRNAFTAQSSSRPLLPITVVGGCCWNTNNLVLNSSEERWFLWDPYFPSTDDFTEDLLNLHEAEIKTLKKYHEDHKELFEGVTKWQDNWTLYLELDVSTDPQSIHRPQGLWDWFKQLYFGCFSQRKANDPARFNNRGGNLLKEEKQRTDLQKSLPKVSS